MAFVFFTFLLMLSNVAASAWDAQVTKSVKAVSSAASAEDSVADQTDALIKDLSVHQGRADTGGEEDSESEVARLLALQFSEPLPVVMARAKEASKTLPLDDAMKQVGKTVLLSTEVHAVLAQDPLHRSLVDANSTGGMGVMSKVFDKAMAFLNDEFKTAREKMDIKLFECGFFKLEKEGLLYETQDTLDEIATGIANTEATIERCTGEIHQLEHHIEIKRGELKEHLDVCAKIRAQLEKEKAIIEEDLRVINLILDVSKEECGVKTFLLQACVSENGMASFEWTSRRLEDAANKLNTVSAKKEYQRMLFEMYGGLDALLPGQVDFTLLEDEAGDFQDDFIGQVQTSQSLIQSESKLRLLRGAEGPPVATKNVASSKAQAKKCSVADKPNCPKLLDKLDNMKGEITDALDAKTAELNKHNTECKRVADVFNNDIVQALNQLTVVNVELAKATGMLASLQIEQSREEKVKHELCVELRNKYTECYSELKELQSEMCGLLKIRQAVYNRVKLPNLKPGEPTMMIQDCEMGDWVIGPCSSTCVDMYGNPGQQLITRSPVVKWDPTSEEGKYGATCPPSMVSRDCSNVPCPIDCQMGEWSGWSKCSKDCGGGQQGRSREVMLEAQYGGKECASSGEERLCNTDSCDQDCVLSEWGGWSACTKPCKWRSSAIPGSQTRTKGIKVAAKGNGKCPKPKTRARFSHQVCNNFVCPKDIQCVADMDVLLVLDGSGSLWYRYGPKDRNFKLMQKFTIDLVRGSRMAKMDDKGRAKGGLRYGVILFSWSPQVVAHITEKADDVISKVKAMKWPKGATFTGQALMKSIKLFGVAGGVSRQQVVVLVTDGRASNKNRARKAAQAVRKTGIRLVLVPVGRAVKMEAEMCSWATRPCAENLLKTPSWKMLISKLKWYMTTFCSVMEIPPKP